MCKIQLNLKNELKKFGLNPAEWTLRRLTRQRFHVVHVADQEFYFLGETKSCGLFQEWTNLQLVSC